MANLDQVRKKHEDAVNNQKSSLRGSLDPADHAKAAVASQSARDASSEAHNTQVKKDIYGIAIDPHYDPKRRHMAPQTTESKLRNQMGQVKDWASRANLLWHLGEK